MTLVCISHGAEPYSWVYCNNIFNPIYQSWDKITQGINPKWGQMYWPCPDYSKKDMTIVHKSHGIQKYYI